MTRREAFRRSRPEQIPTGNRHNRMLARSRRAERRTDKEPELAPVVCGCGVVLGLAAPDQELFCVDCSVWATTDDADALSPRDPEVPA